MTAQIPDLFKHDGRKFSLAGISEGKLFEPESMKLQPVGVCTACWRGYQAIYSIADSRLVLDELNINLADENGNHSDSLGPPINGVHPVEPPGKHKLFRNTYRRLLYPLPYSGGVLIADGFIQDLYVHMGFHPGWKYEIVIELLFKDGILNATIDRSETMAEVRRNVIASRNEGTLKKMTDSEIHDFVAQAFDRRYNM